MAPFWGPEITLRKIYAHIRKQWANGEDSTSAVPGECPLLSGRIHEHVIEDEERVTNVRLSALMLSAKLAMASTRWIWTPEGSVSAIR